MHINKTAGTSIEVALDGWKPKPFHPEKHMDCKSMIGLYGEETWKKYFTFTFVRNPWDRMLSLFLWRQKVGFIPKDANFKDFVMNWDQWKIYRTTKYDISKLNTSGLLERPQSGWFNGDLNFDFVGRFENLQNDFDFVCRNIKMKKNKLQNRYKTIHGHYSLYYDKEMKNKIEQVWGEDIELFKYKFETI